MTTTANAVPHRAIQIRPMLCFILFASRLSGRFFRQPRLSMVPEPHNSKT